MTATRLIAAAALAAAALALGAVLLGGGAYTIHARFVDAGQMVEGGLVEVAGREVGKVTGIRLADDGVAELRLEITDGEWNPLRRGTVARIRTVGLSGVANRYVEITPGPAGGTPIPDGGVLSTAETRPIVDLDTVLNSLDPRTRGRLQRIVRNGSQLFAGATRDANDAFAYLAPALAQSDLLADELARDRAAVARLVRTGATTATALADRRDDLRQGITATATALSAVASERRALAGTLEKAPPLLDRAGGALGGVRATLATVRPALREAQPVAPRLAGVLRRLVPVARAARPVLAETTALLPPLQTSLQRMPALADVAVPALTSASTALIAVQPTVAGLLPYLPDVVGGLINGFGGKQTGYYDANGHYGRISVQAGAATLTGRLGGVPALLHGGGALPGTGRGFTTGNVARCPGGATEPADDGSNPFVANPDHCDPSHDLP